MNSIFLPDKANAKRFRTAFFLLLAGGFLLKLYYLYSDSFSPLFALAVGPDVSEYYGIAQSLAAGKFFPANCAKHAPVYSFFLAAVFQLRIPAIRFLQEMLNLLAFGAMFAGLARLRAFSPKILLTALALTVSSPALLFHCGELISENAVLFFLPFSLLFLSASEKRKAYRMQALAAAGFLAGMAAGAHPLTLSFGVLETAYLAIFCKRKRAAAVFAAALLVPVIVCSIYNSHAAGKAVLIQETGAFNLYLGNNPDADGTCYLRPGAKWKAVHREAAEEARRENVSVNAIYCRRIWDFWKNSPGDAAMLLVKKALLNLDVRENISGADPDRLYRQTTVVLLLALFTVPLLFFFCLAGLFFILRDPRKRVQYAHFLILFAAIFLALTLTVSSGRYRLGMYPAIVLFAAYGIWHFPFRKAYVILPAAAFLLGGAYSYSYQNSEEAAALLGEAEFRRGNLEQAKNYLQYASRFIHDPARFHNLLGLIDWAQKDYNGAENHFRKAIAGAPHELEGIMNLANFKAFRQQKKEAEKLYREGLAKAPEYTDLRYNYALFLQQNNRRREAAVQYRELLERDPGHATAWNALGILLFQSCDYRNALNCFENACLHAPEEPGFRNNRVQCQKRCRP